MHLSKKIRLRLRARASAPSASSTCSESKPQGLESTRRSFGGLPESILSQAEGLAAGLILDPPPTRVRAVFVSVHKRHLLPRYGVLRTFLSSIPTESGLHLW